MIKNKEWNWMKYDPLSCICYTCGDGYHIYHQKYNHETDEIIYTLTAIINFNQYF